MSVKVYEETWDLLSEVLEAVPLNPSVPSTLNAYPELVFRKTGRQNMKAFLVIHVENSFLRATICPSLGGRIIALFDKRRQTDIFPRLTVIDPGEDGELGHGISVLPRRGAGIGPVACQISESETEVAVKYSQILTGSPLDVQVEIVLEEGFAGLTTKITVHNRALLPTSTVCGLIIQSGANVFVDHEPSAKDMTLLPGQAQHHEIVVVPFTPEEGTVGRCQQGSVAIKGSSLTVQVSRLALNHKLFLLTESGETLEAAVDLYPETIKVMELGRQGDQVREVALRGADGLTLFHFPHSAPPAWPCSVGIDFDSFRLDLKEKDAELRKYRYVGGLESASRIALARQDIRREEWVSADEWLELALGFNAFDPLLWWLKSAVRREGDLATDGGEISPERLNAHFLAPDEPALRAEAFLMLGMNLGKEPNPLLRPLAEDLNLGNEVVGLYLDNGLIQSAARLVDELLRHRENPMIRYLMAAQFLNLSGKDAAAAEHVVLAGKCPMEPPFPGPEREREAVAKLAARFPSDARLAQLQGVLQAVATRPAGLPSLG